MEVNSLSFSIELQYTLCLRCSLSPCILSASNKMLLRLQSFYLYASSFLIYTTTNASNEKRDFLAQRQCASSSHSRRIEICSNYFIYLRITEKYWKSTPSC